MLSRFSLVLTLTLLISHGGGVGVQASSSGEGNSVDDCLGWILVPWWLRAPIISHSPSLFKEVAIDSNWNWGYLHGSGGFGLDVDPVRCGLAVFESMSGPYGGGTSVNVVSDWQGTAGLLKTANATVLNLGGVAEILVRVCIDGKFGSGSLELTLRVGKDGDRLGGNDVGVGGVGEAPSPYGGDLSPHLGPGLFPHGFWALGFRLLWAWRHWARSLWLSILLLGDYVGTRKKLNRGAAKLELTASKAQGAEEEAEASAVEVLPAEVLVVEELPDECQVVKELHVGGSSSATVS